jgi:hypothetical protein
VLGLQKVLSSSVQKGQHLVNQSFNEEALSQQKGCENTPKGHAIPNPPIMAFRISFCSLPKKTKEKKKKNVAAALMIIGPWVRGKIKKNFRTCLREHQAHGVGDTTISFADSVGQWLIFIRTESRYSWMSTP